MNQTYTWEFQCKYELQHYPFDTQVLDVNQYQAFILPQECKIEMTVDGFANASVKLLAKQVNV